MMGSQLEKHPNWTEGWSWRAKHASPTNPHLRLVRLPSVVLLPFADLAELAEQKDSPALRPPDGLHDPYRARRALELFHKHAVLGRQDERACPETDDGTTARGHLDLIKVGYLN